MKWVIWQMTLNRGNTTVGLRRTVWKKKRTKEDSKGGTSGSIILLISYGLNSSVSIIGAMDMAINSRKSSLQLQGMRTCTDNK